MVRLFETCERTLGIPTALVNSAGIIESQMRVEQMDGARLQRVFATNVFGPFLCAREAVRRMSTRHGGAVVNVSSKASIYGSPNEYVDYAATKGALDTFTIGLAREVAGEGIRVNAVRAGHMRAARRVRGTVVPHDPGPRPRAADSRAGSRGATSSSRSCPRRTVATRP